MDLEVRAQEARIATHRSTNSIYVTLEGVASEYLNNKDVAECVDIDTYFDAIGEEAIKNFVKDNYDWFK